MGQVENLRRLVLSGKEENLEMVKQLVLSPRLHKARGVLLRCDTRSLELVDQANGEDIIAYASRGGLFYEANCENQPRRRCIDCNELMCPEHFECHVCIRDVGGYDWDSIAQGTTIPNNLRTNHHGK